MMLAPVTHILPLTLIRRARLLSSPGKVLVRVGQEVNATEAVAEVPPRQNHLLLDIPAALGIPRSQFSKTIIDRKVGEKLEEGDVIAESGGLFKRVLRAPAASKVLMIMNSVMLLELQEAPVPLQAGLSGTVVEVLPDRGVIIESTGALIQGIWGNGRINMGGLVTLTESASGSLSADRLDMSLRGGVGLAGCCREKSALLAAANLPLHGLILGSMSADLIDTALEIDLPIVLLEGFGDIPINKKAYKILTTNEKRDVCIHAASLDHYLGERPEILIPLSAAAEFPPETSRFRTGQEVRVLCGPYQSFIGTLEKMNDEPVELPNGLRTKIATMRLENNEIVTIPIMNLEVLE